MWLDAWGWTATAIFSSSYFVRRPAALPRIQAAAALLWVVYGLAIGSAPVVVANLIVGVGAVYASLRAAAVGKGGGETPRKPISAIARRFRLKKPGGGTGTTEEQVKASAPSALAAQPTE